MWRGIKFGPARRVGGCRAAVAFLDWPRRKLRPKPFTTTSQHDFSAVTGTTRRGASLLASAPANKALPSGAVDICRQWNFRQISTNDNHAFVRSTARWHRAERLRSITSVTTAQETGRRWHSSFRSSTWHRKSMPKHGVLLINPILQCIPLRTPWRVFSRPGGSVPSNQN
jgi:hypothetical protein